MMSNIGRHIFVKLMALIDYYLGELDNLSED